jgi:hypothetical protein
MTNLSLFALSLVLLVRITYIQLVDGSVDMVRLRQKFVRLYKHVCNNRFEMFLMKFR